MGTHELGARVMASLLIAIKRCDCGKLRAEVIALRCQGQVLECHIKRVPWTPGDRIDLAALREFSHHQPRRPCW